jgi:hypothetical protein
MSSRAIIVDHDCGHGRHVQVNTEYEIRLGGGVIGGAFFVGIQ